MQRAVGPVGQSAQVGGQPGRHARVCSVQVMQECPGGLGAHVTQQHTLTPQITVLRGEEAFTVHLGAKYSTEGLRLHRCDTGPHTGSSRLRASPCLLAALPQHRHRPGSRQCAGQELCRQALKLLCRQNQTVVEGQAPSRFPLDRHIGGMRAFWWRPAALSRIPAARHSSLMHVGTGQHRNVCQRVD